MKNAFAITKDMAVRVDSWFNAATHLGRAATDKIKGAGFETEPDITAQTLAGMFHSDDMAAGIVEGIVLEALRPGFSIELGGDDAQKAIEDATAIMNEVHRLGAVKALQKGWTWGRLFGGGAVYPIVDDGAEQSEPLRPESIRRIIDLQVFEHPEMQVDSYYSDPMAPKFGKPEVFSITSHGTTHEGALTVRIHESRLILFEGIDMPNTLTSTRQWGGASVLQRAEGPLKGFNMFWAALGHLSQDAAQAVLKVQGLISAATTGNEAALTARAQIMQMGRSVARALMIDAEMEEFERQPHNLGGLDVIAQQFALRLAAASRKPVAIMMGQSPAGLNATGESDMRIRYDQVAQVREADLQPQMEALMKIIMLAKEGPTKGIEPEWEIEWKPFRQMSEIEIASLRKTVAETDRMYITDQVVTPEEVTTSRFRDTGYSMEMQIDEGLRDDVIDAQDASEPVEPEPAPEPTDDDASAPEATPEAADPGTAFNGAQVQAMAGIVAQVIAGEMPRDTAAKVLAIAFPISEAEAAALIGTIPEDFGEKDPPPPALQANADNPPPIPPPPSGDDVEGDDDDQDAQDADE